MADIFSTPRQLVKPFFIPASGITQSILPVAFAAKP
jgi:hypothetical protein